MYRRFDNLRQACYLEHLLVTIPCDISHRNFQKTTDMKLIFALLVLVSTSVPAQEISKERLQTKLDSLRVAGNYPGLSVAIHFSDNKKVAIVSGFADKEAMRPL